MKKTNLFFVIIAMVFAIGFTSCSKDDDSNSTTSPIDGFTFANVGNSAIYDLTISVMGQTFNGSMTITILEKYSNNVVKVKMDMNLGIPTVPNQVDTGYWLVSPTEFADVDDAAGTNKFLYTTNNPIVNTRYSIGNGTDSTYRDIISINDSIISTPGTYTCIKVRETDNSTDDENYYYINKNIGLVKMQTTADGGQIGAINLEAVLKSKNY